MFSAKLNMQNYSINLQYYYKTVICPSSTYEDSNSDYIKFVESFIKNNKEFFLERGFNLDYFTVEQALKYPVLITNRLREPLSLGFTLETSAKKKKINEKQQRSSISGPDHGIPHNF